jgi:hypothetical protein
MLIFYPHRKEVNGGPESRHLDQAEADIVIVGAMGTSMSRRKSTVEKEYECDTTIITDTCKDSDSVSVVMKRATSLTGLKVEP